MLLKWISYIGIFILSIFIKPFVKIKDDLLVFGCRGGIGFEGNTKYLYLYGIKHTDFDCIFITKNKKIYKNLSLKGYKVVYYYSLKAVLLTLRAKYIFITHGLLDIPPVWFKKNNCIINVWHGIPIKKINLCDKNIRKVGRILDILRDYRTNYFISNSKRFNIYYKQCFNLTDKKLKVLGLARINYLIKPEMFIDNKNQKSNKKIFLYAPTFRDYKVEYEFLKKENLEKIQVFLEKNDYKLWIKLHPFVTKNLNLKEYKNIKMIEANEDVYELLPLVDVLISDYSSIIIDFLIAYPYKQLLLYCFDLEKYKQERGFVFNFENKFKNIIFKEFDELFQIITNGDNKNGIDREFFYNMSLLGKECELHFNKIKQKIFKC